MLPQRSDESALGLASAMRPFTMLAIILDLYDGFASRGRPSGESRRVHAG